jgi:hypothetical protein
VPMASSPASANLGPSLFLATALWVSANI